MPGQHAAYFNSQPHIDEVSRFDLDDVVVKLQKEHLELRHGRAGLTRVHKHFDVDEHEVCCIKPFSKHPLEITLIAWGKDLIPVMWAPIDADDKWIPVLYAPASSGLNRQFLDDNLDLFDSLYFKMKKQGVLGRIGLCQPFFPSEIPMNVRLMEYTNSSLKRQKFVFEEIDKACSTMAVRTIWMSDGDNVLEVECDYAPHRAGWCEAWCQVKKNRHCDAHTEH